MQQLKNTTKLHIFGGRKMLSNEMHVWDDSRMEMPMLRLFKYTKNNTKAELSQWNRSIDWYAILIALPPNKNETKHK